MLAQQTHPLLPMPAAAVLRVTERMGQVQLLAQPQVRAEWHMRASTGCPLAVMMMAAAAPVQPAVGNTRTRNLKARVVSRRRVPPSLLDRQHALAPTVVAIVLLVVVQVRVPLAVSRSVAAVAVVERLARPAPREWSPAAGFVSAWMWMAAVLAVALAAAVAGAARSRSAEPARTDAAAAER